jgi:hypothetical protein
VVILKKNIMKLKSYYIILLGLILGISSCKKDNYEAPASTLKGRLLYNQEVINLQYNQVPFELYQPGFGKTGPIASTFSQDGTYSTLLFDGSYKLIINPSQGPFTWNKNASGGVDSLAINVSGDQTLDLQVIPYYLVRNAAYSVAGNALTANFSVDQIITGANAKTIERVNLYINKTQFVSGNGDENIAGADVAGSAITNPASMSLTVTVPTISPVQNYVFARVGVKISGVEDMIFSPLQKIQL